MAALPVALALALFGCVTAVQRDAALPYGSAATPPSVAAAGAAGPKAPAPLPRSAAPEPSGKASVADPLPRDAQFEADWQWLKTRFPDAANYREAASDPLPNQLLEWAKPGESITVFDRACRGVRVQRRDEDLHGFIHRGFTLDLDGLQESLDEITIGEHLDLASCNSVNYERDAEGNWELSSSGGGPCQTALGHALSKVTAEAAWYDDAVVRLSLECPRKVEEHAICLDGARRTCSRCDAWLISTHSDQFGMGFGATAPRKVKLPAAVDCSAPCPPIERPEDVKRADAILRDRQFFTELGIDRHPFVFRTERACKAYGKIHRFSRAERDVWTANDKVGSATASAP